MSSYRAGILSVSLTLVALVVAPRVASAWTPATAMAVARNSHTATALKDGSVLVVGGFHNNAPSASAELYDLNTHTWGSAGTLTTARAEHTATLLPDGRVLVVGGLDGGSVLASVEIFDPGTKRWSVVRPLPAPRRWHTATLLPGTKNKVLVAGGIGAGATVLATAEIYDPDTDTWTAARPMHDARVNFTATPVLNALVFVAGGQGTGALASTEVYDPKGDTWLTTRPLSHARVWHTATLLSTGDVLIAGGTTGDATLDPLAELYTPLTDRWRPAGAMSVARYSHDATALPGGKVLVSGGVPYLGPFTPWDTAELYTPEPAPGPGTWTTTSTLTSERWRHTSTLLGDGTVLVAGGWNFLDVDLNTAEIYP